MAGKRAQGLLQPFMAVRPEWDPEEVERELVEGGFAGFKPYGDMPILFWHGRRTWTEREYRNLCREPFSWNTQREPPEAEATYTLFLYEQMKAILEACDRHRLTPEQKDGLFWASARRALKLA